MDAFQLCETPLDLQALRENLLADGAGAYTSYEGWVRDKNLDQPVAVLEYHGYPQLAPSIAAAILAETHDRFDIHNAAFAHRTGRLSIGEVAIWVGVTATHRDAAFVACRYIVDQAKVRLPIWKKEMYTDGHSAWIQSRVGAPDEAVASSDET
ncbi:MAG: molybdopterin synthase catalytic subunit [Kiritimatiellia bacterium]|jgi:molybdopterin synthase catalytic subunit